MCFVSMLKISSVLMMDTCPEIIPSGESEVELAGGTFALFSQLRRAGDLATPDSNALPSDKELSTYTVGPRNSTSSKGSAGLTSPLFGRKSSGPTSSPPPAGTLPPGGAGGSTADAALPSLNPQDAITSPGDALSDS